MEIKTRATIVDVAEAAGVGVGTVSRVINNASGVRPTTDRRVRQTIARLGYQVPPPSKRPGPSLGRRRGGRTMKRMMLLVHSRGGLRWIFESAPVYAAVLQGIEAAVYERGCELTIRHAGTQDAMDTLLQDSDPDGLIIFGYEADVEDHAALKRRPVVWVMGGSLDVQHDFVLPDHSRVGALAATYVLDQGFQQAAYLGTLRGSPNWLVGYRGDGFAAMLARDGVEVTMLLDESLVTTTSASNAANQPILRQLIEQFAQMNPRPEVLMLQADLLAPSVYRELQAHGIAPQRDVTIITCNNERPYLSSLHPQPVIIDLQAEAIGRQAVERLAWRAEHPNEPICRLMVEPLLVPPDES